jgi:hypothetical protein
MKRITRLGLVVTVCVAQSLFGSPPGEAQTPPARSGVAARPEPEAPQAPERTKGEELTAQDREVLGWADELAGEMTKVLDKWVSSRAVTEDMLFSRLYYPIPKTDPPKFTTDYDALADRDVQPIEDRYLAKSSALVYAILTDVNGYVPSHNKQYAQPLTGNRAVDLVNNRTKRLFLDRTGYAAARSVAPHLLQHYQRDNGDEMRDLSVPVRWKGRHWGSVRFGYRAVQK